MTEKILESQLVIGATDKTGAAFAGAAKNAEQLRASLGNLKNVDVGGAHIATLNRQIRDQTRLLHNEAAALREVRQARELANIAFGKRWFGGRIAEEEKAILASAGVAKRAAQLETELAGLKNFAPGSLGFDNANRRIAEQTQLLRAERVAAEELRLSLQRSNAAMGRRGVGVAGAPEAGTSRIGGLVGPLAAGYAVYESAHFLHAIAEKTAHAAVQGQHERVRMEAAGMTPGERGEAEDVAARLSSKIMPLSQTTLLHMLRNARSIVGSYEEAAKVVEPMAKLRVIAMGAHPERAEELEEDFDKLIKGMEIKGVTQNLPKFKHYMDNMAKAINVFGDTLRMTDYFAMFKYGRGATQALSDQFMLMTAPTFAQELGGSSAGKALSTFYQTLVGGRMQVKAANELLDLGLIGDKSKVKISKAGIVTSVKPGAVLGWQLAAADPYRWVNEIFLPALRKRGITDKTQILGEIATVFRDATAQQLVTVLATQQSRIMKDWRMVAGAEGLGAADTFLNKDVGLAFKSVTEQLQNLFQAAGSPMAPAAARYLNDLARGISNLTAVSREHPVAAGGGMIAAMSGSALAVYEGVVLALGKFGMLSQATAHSLARAPLAVLGSAALPLTLGGFGTVEWLRGLEAQNQSGKAVNREIIASLPWYRRAAIWMQENIFGADPNRLVPELGASPFNRGAGYFRDQATQLKALVEGAAPGWLESVNAQGAWRSQAEAPSVELKGDATVTVKIEAPEWLETMVEQEGHIPGIKVTGTTGSVGRSWGDVGGEHASFADRFAP